jgi:hypothetical protein
MRMALPLDPEIECALIIPMIIQTTGLPPSGSDQIDAVPDVSRPDPTGSVQVDAEPLSRNRKVLGSNPSSGSISAGQSRFSPRCWLLLDGWSIHCRMYGRRHPHFLSDEWFPDDYAVDRRLGKDLGLLFVVERTPARLFI